MDLKNIAYLDEPFVLANNVAQVFYVKDMSTKPRKMKNKQKNTSDDEPKRHIVLSGKRNTVGVEDKTDMSEDYDKFHEIPPFAVKDDPTAPLFNEDAPWLRHKKNKNTRWERRDVCNTVKIALVVCNKVFLAHMCISTC